MVVFINNHHKSSCIRQERSSFFWETVPLAEQWWHRCLFYLSVWTMSSIKFTLVSHPGLTQSGPWIDAQQREGARACWPCALRELGPNGDTNTVKPLPAAAHKLAGRWAWSSGWHGPMAQTLRVQGSLLHRFDFPMGWGHVGNCLASQWVCPNLCSSAHRAAVSFLRNLASLTGGRYHCPVGEDTLFKIHGLLTKDFVDERVGCTATEWGLLKWLNEMSATWFSPSSWKGLCVSCKTLSLGSKGLHFPTAFLLGWPSSRLWKKQSLGVSFNHRTIYIHGVFNLPNHYYIH